MLETLYQLLSAFYMVVMIVHYAIFYYDRFIAQRKRRRK